MLKLEILKSIAKRINSAGDVDWQAVRRRAAVGYCDRK